ncbi:ABC transporter permease [Kribbella sp. DT2]|uniref:ABC transporter permease n=1 Tax=Kribbella sp. DT2 TaxID=3393427 RepID=UPI003CEF1E67
MIVLTFAWSTVKSRWPGFAGAFIALFCGAALLSACGFLLQSGLLAGISPERYAGASVVVAANQKLAVPESPDTDFGDHVPLDANQLAEIAAVPGVAQAVPDYSFRLTLAGKSGALVHGEEGGTPSGHGRSSVAFGPLSVRDGALPTGRSDVALDRDAAAAGGYAIGDQVRVAVGSRPASYRLTGIVDPPSGSFREPVVLFTDEVARQLSGQPGQLYAVGVLAAPGVDRADLADAIEQGLGDSVTTATGDDRGKVEFQDSSAASGLLMAVAGSFGGIAAIVAMFVVAGTLGLSIQQRRRELALLRAVAATPRQVHRMIGAEILIVSLAASVPGAALGYGLVWLLRAAFVRIGVIPADYGLSLLPVPILVAVLLSVLTAQLAGWMSARRAVKIRPVEALGESSVETPQLGPVRTLIGLGLLAGGLVMCAVPVVVAGEVGTIVAASSSLVLVIGVALLGPRIVQGALTLVGPVLRRSGGASGYLAAANLAQNSRRVAGAVVPLVLAITIMIVQVSVGAAQVKEAGRQADQGVVADLVVASSGAGLSPDLVDDIHAVPGVRTATAVTRGPATIRYTDLGDDSAQSVLGFPAQGVDVTGLASTLDLDVRKGDLGRLEGQGTVALSESAAQQTRTGLGRQVEMFLGDGTRLTPVVVAIYHNGMGFGDVTLPRDVLLDHLSTRLDDSVLVRAEAGVDASALSETLTKRFAGEVGVVLADRQTMAEAQQAGLDLNRWTNLILLAALFGYVAINVANSLVMSTTARRREFALLRLVGIGKRQVRRMMLVEAAVVIGAALVVSAALCLPPMVGVTVGLSEGATVIPAFSPVATALTAGGVVLLGLLSIMLPTRRVLRHRPVDAIGIRE